MTKKKKKNESLSVFYAFQHRVRKVPAKFKVDCLRRSCTGAH